MHCSYQAAVQKLYSYRAQTMISLIFIDAEYDIKCSVSLWSLCRDCLHKVTAALQADADIGTREIKISYILNNKVSL